MESLKCYAKHHSLYETTKLKPSCVCFIYQLLIIPHGVVYILSCADNIYEQNKTPETQKKSEMQTANQQRKTNEKLKKSFFCWDLNLYVIYYYKTYLHSDICSVILQVCCRHPSTWRKTVKCIFVKEFYEFWWIEGYTRSVDDSRRILFETDKRLNFTVKNWYLLVRPPLKTYHIL